MSFDPDTDRRILAVLDAPASSRFIDLVRISGLDPAHSFRGADFAGVSLKGAILADFDLTGADLSGALGLKYASFVGAITADVKWPGNRSLTPGTRFRDQPHFPEMVVIPPGRFIMGSDKTGPHAEPGHFKYESPAREVGIAAAFALGRLPVTQGEYAAFVKATRHDAGTEWQKPRADDHPVTHVSWIDAEAFIDWLNTGLPDKPYRLPTEAEWEYAARGQTVLGPRTEFATGARIEPNQAQYDWSNSHAGSKTRSKGATGTAVAGSFQANAFGLHDMHGNVWEWTQDAFRDSYNGAPDDGSAVEFTPFEYRVLRGGSWGIDPWVLRSADRSGGQPSLRAPWLGVRVARTL